MHRSGEGGTHFDGNDGVSNDDKDLVAYWKFDEGVGYVVKDATGHGHDLRASSTPHWQVCPPPSSLNPDCSLSRPAACPVIVRRLL